tara:strand:- start:6870 stop:7244 length:375 start_codon:yes stop_codon:yes gene_type:complete
MFLLILSVISLIIFYVFGAVKDNPIVISKHTKYLNVDMVCSIIKAIKSIESRKGANIQFLLNTENTSKKEIEEIADSIMMKNQVFVLNQFDLDHRDFARLITLYMDLLRDANDSDIREFISSLY